MDRNSTIRSTIPVVLILGAVLAWTYLFPPPPPEAVEDAAAGAAVEDAREAEGLSPRERARRDAEARARDAAPPAPAEPEPSGQQEAVSAEAMDAAEAVQGEPGQEPIVLRTNKQEITLTARGGRVLTWKLLEFRREPADPNSGPIDLVAREARAANQLPLSIETGDPELTARVNDAWYVVDRSAPGSQELSARELPEGTERVRFRFADGAGLEVEKTYFVSPSDGYLTHFEWSIRQNGSPLPGAVVSWGPGIAEKPENASTYTRTRESAWVALPSGVQQHDVGDLGAGEVYVRASRDPRWLALDDRYFAVAMIFDEPGDAYLRTTQPVRSGGDEEPRTLVVESGAESLTLFTGPKKDGLLHDLDAQLGTRMAELIDWGFFGWIARPLFLALDWLHDVLGNWGIAIVVITIGIRLLFVPLTHKSMVSMRRTQERMGKLQPKVRKIKEKYKDKRDVDARRKMNEEMMALYNKEGVNPMASLTGCLPMLLQLPVLWAMLSVLTVVVELRGAPFFGWIQDLSAPDPIYVTPVVMGLTMFYQQMKMTAKTDDPQQRSQQRIMMIMPVMFTWFFLWAPAGLVIYWLVNNVLGIGQQFIVNKHADEGRGASAAAAKS